MSNILLLSPAKDKEDVDQGVNLGLLRHMFRLFNAEDMLYSKQCLLFLSIGNVNVL